LKQPYHIPVLLDEAINGLSIKPDGVYVDCTFGGGGHAKALLEKLGSKGKLIAFDQDKDAKKSTRTMEAMMKMVKLDIAELKRAFEG